MPESRLDDGYGYSNIPNGLVMALANTNLSPYEGRIVWYVIRKTYGWKKRFDRISYSQFEAATGLNRRHIARTLDGLMNRRILICQGTGYKLEYGIQSDLTMWLKKPLPKEAKNHAKTQGESLPDEATISEPESLPEEVTNSLPDEATISEPESLPEKVTNSLPIEATNVKAESLPLQGKSLPLQDKPLPEEATNSLPIQVNTKETINTTKEITKEIGGPSPQGYGSQTPASKYYFEKSHKKRFANEVQKDEFEKAEAQVGYEAMKKGIDWALTSGISNVKSIITAAKTFWKEKGGKYDAGKQPPAEGRAQTHQGVSRPYHITTDEERLRALKKPRGAG